jgi:cytochrome b
MAPFAAEFYRVRVWDLPTRLLHWALVLSIGGSLVTGMVGGSAMVWHLRLGQAALGLLLFRLLWGVVGGRWSRFASFPLSPRALKAYLQGRNDPALSTGHSPLGSLSVLGFLALLTVQVGSGLLSNDDIAFSGPLSHLVSNATVATATGFHKTWGKLLVLAWVLLHLVALIVYARRGRKLVPAMVHGDKTLDEPMPGSRDDRLSRLGAALLLAACLAASAWVFSLAPAGF